MLSVPVTLVTVSSVLQLPGRSVAEYWTVSFLPAVPLIEKVKLDFDKLEAPRLAPVPPPLPPIVIKVKEVSVPRTAPVVYLGLVFVAPVTLMKTIREFA